MESPQQYFAAETERMIKLQDVLLKAMAKKITWWEAAEIIGVTDRTMRPWANFCSSRDGGGNCAAEHIDGRLLQATVRNSQSECSCFAQSAVPALF